jgi:hypothetical protein
MEAIQVELTNACIFRCGNCTRFCGSHYTPFYLTFDQFKEAIDSMVGFPNIVGFMGGEPLLHPQFEKFADYALEKLGKAHLGLWSTFPKGKEDLREVICRTFDHLFLNDHSVGNIFHAPILAGIEEVIPDEREMFAVVEQCWLQNSWSASINPNGAFFCEVAGAMSVLFQEEKPLGWKVEPGWWMRIPKDFTAQMEKYCRRCSCAIPLARRSSQDERDDISPKNLELLKGKSKKVDRGEYVVTDFKLVEQPDPNGEMPTNYPVQVYKDLKYRGEIADRYGIFISLNEKGNLTPYLKDKWTKGASEKRMTLMDQYKQEFPILQNAG